MTYQSFNPATEKLLKTFEEISDKKLEAKMAAAAKCFAVWRKNSYNERAVIINKVAALMLEQKETLAHTMSIEMSKRIAEARGEVEFSSHILSYYAKNAERFLTPVALHPAIGEAQMENSPIGVLFAVEP